MIETWRETHKGYEDYWERKSDKATRFYDTTVQALVKQDEEMKQKESTGTKQAATPDIEKAFSELMDKQDDKAAELGSGTEKLVLLRCGQGEYRNNRNYEYAEKWEEYANGTLQKKTVLDDGFGKRSLKHYG